MELSNRWLVGLLLLGLSACQKNTVYPLTGYVEGETVYVAPSVSGRVTSLTLKRGASVTLGQALFTLDADKEQAAVDQANAQLAQAQAQAADLATGKRPTEIDALKAAIVSAQATLKAAESEFKRQQDLVKQGYLPAGNLDTYRAQRDTALANVNAAQAQLKTAQLPSREQARLAAEEAVKAAQAALTQAQWQLTQKSVIATRAGLVTDTFYQPGEWVATGNPVLSILPPENRKIRFFIPETQVGSIHIGQALSVQCDGCGQPIPMKISYIAPQAEYTPPVIYSQESRSKLVFMVEALPDIADATRLSIGQPVDVSLL